MAFNKRTIEDTNLKVGQTVILRADFNVPIDEAGNIVEDYRIRQTLPTINYLLDRRVKLVIISHLGRPEGKLNPLQSLAPVAKRLDELINVPVEFVEDCMGEKVQEKIAEMEVATVLLLENLRFHIGEELDDDTFAGRLASYGELFVQDGFGVVHRKAASTTGIPRHLPTVGGLLLEKEICAIDKVIDNPLRPLLVVMGGAKISDKIGLVKKMIDVADALVVGGAMANTFFKAQGIDIGKSIYEPAALAVAEEILQIAKKKQQASNFTFYLPQDGVIATKVESSAKTRIVDWGHQGLANIEAYPKHPDSKSFEVADNEMILDIGPQSASYIVGLTRLAKTVIWNGNLGLSEVKPLIGSVGPFENGSRTLLKAIDKSHAPKDQFSLVGGGDTTSYVLNTRGINLPEHVSTGGGATLEYMSGGQLPGLGVLQDR